TVGGNINQRPRCWYYRNEEFVCYKKGGSRCFAVNGENQYHAIFGNEGPSHIVHPSSLAVPLVAYGAKFRVAGPSGAREIAAAEAAVREASQMSGNSYNIQIAKTSVKRAIMNAAGLKTV